MDFKNEEAFGLTVIIIAIVFALVLAGAGLHFLDRSMLDDKTDELARSAARMGLSKAIEAVQRKVGSETWSDPLWATFFQDTDINGDGIIARDGEIDRNMDGTFDVSIYKVYSAKGRNGEDDDGDGVIDDLPHEFYLNPGLLGLNDYPEIAPTLEDVNGNKIQDELDEILEDAFGNILKEGGIPVEDEEPDDGGERYHPIFNPSETKGNGIGVLDTIEDGLQKWLRYSERVSIGASMSGIGSKDYFADIYVRVIDTSSKINLNGTDLLTTRLLNNLLRVAELVPHRFPPEDEFGESTGEKDNPATEYIDERGDGKDSDGDSIVDDGTFIGLNSRGIEYDCELDGEIFNDPLITNKKNNLGTTTARADDADAVLIIKHRNSLPGMRFQSVDQILDVLRPSEPGTLEPPACTSPGLMRKAGIIFDRENINRDPAQTNSQAIVIDNRDEFERLKDFVTVEGWRDETTVKQALLASNPSGLEFEPRFPVNLYAATKEVLHAVIATGFENPDGVVFDAVETLVKGIISDRINEPFPFTSWKEFEDYMDNKIGTDTPKIDPVLLENKARLIAQLVPNTRLQRFNPNRALIRPLDKTHIGTPTTELSLSHSGYYEIDVLAVVKEAGPRIGQRKNEQEEDEQFVLVDDEWYSLVHNIKGTSTGGNEVGRRRITAVVKVMDILRHTTQTDFEGYGTSTPSPWLNTRSLSGVSSYPENMKDVWLGMGSSTSYSAGFKPTALAVDEITGNVYVGGTGTSTIPILGYKKNSNELLSVGTAQSSGAGITFLSIDPFFTSTDFGRMYAGIVGSKDIDVFDVMGTTTSRDLYLRPAGNIGTETVIPKKIALDAGRKVIVAIGSSSTKLLEWHYQIGTPTVASFVGTIDNLRIIEDIAFDSTLEQFFILDTDTVAGTVSSYGYTGTDTVTLRNVGTYTADFQTKSISVNTNDNILYILGTSTADELLKIKYSTGTPTAFNELERLPLGSITTNAKQMVVDEDDDLIFILSEGAKGTVTAVNARNERLQIMPVSQIGTITNDAKAIGVDSKRNRVYIAEGSNQKVKMFEYLIGTTTAKKETWTDGYIQLTHNSIPRWGTATMLYSSNFQGDYNLMGTNTANQFGTNTPILVGTGTPLLIVARATQTAYGNGSLFIQDEGTVTVRLAPDGVIVQTISGTGPVSGSVVAYDPASLFGVGAITDDVDGRGIRYGAMEFWIKFSERKNVTDEVVLSRLLYNVELENDIFVEKDGRGTRGEQLQNIMGTDTSISDDFSWGDSGSTTTYTTFSKLSLKDFGIDNATLELERFSFPGTITVTGVGTDTANQPVSFINEPIYPGTATYCVGTTSIALEQGKWQNIAYNWWIETTGSSTEIVKQELFVNESGTITTGQYIGTDTSFLLGTITTRLKDLPDVLASATSTMFHIGAKIFGTATTSSFMATIDGLVLYSGTSSVNGEPKRFGTESGYLIRSFDQIIPAGSRLGTISWTEYLPGSSSVSFDITLKAMDGRILEQFKTGTGTEGKGTRLVVDPGTSTNNYLVKEDATLEYRANLYAVGTQTESPVIDDVTVTVIRKKPEIISIIER